MKIPHFTNIKATKLLIWIVMAFTISNLSAAQGTWVSYPSNHDVATTADKLEQALKEEGMTVFARVNHSEGAKKVDIELRPTELVIFGNPKVGTPLMHCAQTVALDLPQKALIYEDEAGKTWLLYNNPDYLKTRHGLEGCDQVLAKISAALKNFAEAATE